MRTEVTIYMDESTDTSTFIVSNSSCFNVKTGRYISKTALEYLPQMLKTVYGNILIIESVETYSNGYIVYGTMQ